MKESVNVDDREVEIMDWLPEKRTFKVGSGPSAQAHIATFYYPYWKAFINTKPVEVKKDENGAIAIPVDTVEECDVELVFKEPPINKAASWVSLISWVLAGALVALGKVVRFRATRLDLAGR
jgi:hypothetical protein